MDVKIIPFKKEHLEVMEIRDHENVLMNQSTMAERLEQTLAMTGIIDGRVICCFGVAPYYGTIADVWLLPSKYIDDYAVTVAKGARRFLNEAKQDLGLERMETCCLIDDLHDRWMKFLGFEVEGIKKKYYNGVDYKMWGKTWE